MSEPYAPGWQPNPDTGGTRFWDGTAFTGDLLPASHGSVPLSRGIAAVFGLVALGTLVASLFAGRLNDDSVSTLKLFLILFSISLLTFPTSVLFFRRRARWIRWMDNRQAVSRRLAELKIYTAKREQQQKKDRRWAAVGQLLTPAQSPEQQLQTSRALRNLHHLKETGAMTDYEYERQKRKLLG